MSEFMAMGGYGAYVWPAFGLTLLVMFGLAGTSLRALRRVERELSRLEERGLGRRSDRFWNGGPSAT